MKKLLLKPKMLLLFTKRQFQSFQFLILSLLFTTSLKASPVTSKERELLSRQSISFIENKGQIKDANGNMQSDILFSTTFHGTDVYLDKNGIHYVFHKLLNPEAREKALQLGIKEPLKYQVSKTDMILLHANPNPTIVAEEPEAAVSNYINGISGEKTVKEIKSVHHYKRIVYKEVYPHIDFILYTKNNKVEYDFVVRPGGKVSDIQFSYNGDTKVSENNNGELNITSTLGQIVEGKPYSYQENEGTKQEISSQFILNNNTIQFALAKYDKRKTLTIDPTVLWSTYFGGESEDIINAVTTDAQGRVYIAGATQSQRQISTVGAYQENYKQGFYKAALWNAFIACFDDAGHLLWSSYYLSTTYPKSVNSDDKKYAIENFSIAYGVCVDKNGNIFITGEEMADYTDEKELMGYEYVHDGHCAPRLDVPSYFPPKETDYMGRSASFVVKFDINGNLIWKVSYGGGFETEKAKLDGGSDNLANLKQGKYVIGTTRSKDIAVDNDGNVFIVGTTNRVATRIIKDYTYGCFDEHIYSSLTTPSVFEFFNNGKRDEETGINDYNGFVAKIDGKEGNLLWGTYYGGDSTDALNGVCIDGKGDVLVAGTTKSKGENIITPMKDNEGAKNNGGKDAIIAKFNGTTGRLFWGRYFGSNGDEEANDIAIDNNGLIYVVGSTTSHIGIAYDAFRDQIPGFQTIYQDIHAGGGDRDGFIAKFHSNNGQLWLATYYGGQLDDELNSVAVDKNNKVYVAGTTYSTTIESQCDQPLDRNQGLSDAMLARFSSDGKREWGIYYGGLDEEQGNAVAISNTGQLYMAGATLSDQNIAYTDGSQQWSIHQKNYGKERDGFLVRFFNVSCKSKDAVALIPDVLDGVKHRKKVRTNIENSSTKEYTRGIIHYSVNGVEQDPYRWEGNLIPGNSTSVEIGEFDAEDPNMDYKITVWAEMVNKEETIENIEPVTIIYRSSEAAAISKKAAIEKSSLAITSEKLNVYPNPSKAISTINFTAKQSGPATLKVYNAFGKVIATLFNGIVEKGKQYQQIFNGQGLSNGVYLIKLQNGKEISTQKLLLTK